LKVEIILPAIERWHCVDLLLENLRLAVKPPDVRVLCVLSSSDAYYDKLKDGLGSIFSPDCVRIIRNPAGFIEHDQLRIKHYETNLVSDGEDIRLTKLKAVYDTYSLVLRNVDRNADMYWFIEDDTLFQLDIYSKYRDYMKVLDADIVTGVSYYLHTESNHSRNFWNITMQKQDNGDKEMKLTTIPCEHGGVVKLGATGLGNVLAKRETVLTWAPETYSDIGSGADISFFFNAMKKDYKAYGIWNIYLPHITKHTGGDIEIRGRIDKSLIPILSPFKSGSTNGISIGQIYAKSNC